MLGSRNDQQRLNGFTAPVERGGSAGTKRASISARLGRLFPPGYLPQERQLFLRLALGFACAPVPALLLTMSAALMIYYLDEGDLDRASNMTWDTLRSLAAALYFAVFAGGVPALLALWAFGLRGRMAYLGAGLAVGGLTTLALYYVDGMMTPISLVYMALASALSMLTLRRLIGVRKAKKRNLA